ncbi:MAG: mandelate racemase/muconate lactonizing enzyme family protein [Lysobacterales bacterium]
MKITRVIPHLMSSPLSDPLKLPFHGGERTIFKRDALLIEVQTDGGITGWGPGPAHEEAARVIRDVIAPLLAGRNPADWAEMPETGSPGTVKALRAVQLALVDAAARAEGCPASELLGGRVRDRIKLYGSAGMYMEPEQYAAEAVAIAGLGYAAYKMRPALGPERDMETMARMREAVGPEFGLMVDAHTWWRMGDSSYGLQQVGELVEAMTAYRPTWLEEPLPPQDHAAYRELRSWSGVPIASGEHEPDDGGFDDLVTTGCVDWAQMDLLCQGGVATARRIFEQAPKHGVRFAFHSWGTDLEVLAAAHLGVCWPAETVEWLEHPCHERPGRAGMYPFPLASEILAEALPIEMGNLVVPDRPGFGIDIDRRVIERYPYLPGPWSEFRIDSPPSITAVTGDHSLRWVEEDGD